MISTLIAEATICDFKEALEVKKPKSWLKSVSAFANTAGGTLFFGVDNSHNVVGLTDPQKDAEDKLRESVSKLVLESASSRGGSDTYQYVFSGLKCSVGELRAQLSGIPGISSVNVFLDKPGGIR